MRGMTGRDDGAVIVLVAILVAAGVVTGLLALVADVGQLYAERRVVQNGADAAALAIAQHCAEGDAECADQMAAGSVAVTYSGANAPDEVTGVRETCGTDGLGECSSLMDAWWDCQPIPDEINHFARVRTATENPDGTDFLVPFFAGVGSEDPAPELRTGACSQAAWGPASSAPVLFPILLPVCPGLPVGSAVTVSEFTPSDPDDACEFGGDSFAPVTNGFAFGDFDGTAKFSGQSQNCTEPVPVAIGDWIHRETSEAQWCGTSSANITEALSAMLNTEFIVPVVGARDGTGIGTSAQFQVMGFRSFEFLGFKLKGNEGGVSPVDCSAAGKKDDCDPWPDSACSTAPSIDYSKLKNKKQCEDESGTWDQDTRTCTPPDGYEESQSGNGNNGSCLFGAFGEALVDGGVGGGPDLGVKAVQLLP